MSGAVNEERFRASIHRMNAPSGCWEWVGPRTREGYGVVRVGNTTTTAHRVAHGLFIGPIPAGLQIDHLCRNPWCVNPDHLEAVTPSENTHRMGHGRETHCLRGHEFTPENTRVWRGWRFCRRCQAIRSGAYEERRKTSTGDAGATL